MDPATILFIVFAIVMVAMHVFGHGGHGSHGRGSPRHRNDAQDRPETSPQDEPSAVARRDHTGHAHH